jgi:hypothetical protein
LSLKVQNQSPTGTFADSPCQHANGRYLGMLFARTDVEMTDGARRLAEWLQTTMQTANAQSHADSSGKRSKRPLKARK